MTRDVRRDLSDFFRHQAYFRQEKARQFPGDERNQDVSNGLLELAGYVMGLRADDERLAVFVEQYERLDGMFELAPDSYASHLSTRFHFNDPFQSYDDFLAEFAEVLPKSVDELLELIESGI